MAGVLAVVLGVLVLPVIVYVAAWVADSRADGFRLERSWTEDEN